jgi:hypothetical protein
VPKRDDRTIKPVWAILKNMKLCKLLLILFLLPVLVHAQSEAGKPEIPGNTNLKRLLNRPDVLYTKVDSVREGDKVWINMEVDIQVCTAISLDKIKRVITDYNNYVRTFRRTSASQIISRGKMGTTAFFEQTVAVMGITVVTGYTVLLETPIDTEGQFLLTFSHISDDGSIRNVYGFWYLESVIIDGKPHTYFRYFSSTGSLKSAVLQKQAISLFIGAEYTGMVKEVLAAAGKIDTAK